MAKKKGIIKSIVTVVFAGGLAIGGYFLYKNFDTIKNTVSDWWNNITNQEEQKPTQNEELKDFTFSGNKITGYKGSDVVLDNLPTSYSMEIGNIEETLEISLDDMSDEEAMSEFNEKIMNSSFYCTPNGGDRFFFATYQEWNDYMSKNYPNEEQMKAFPMKFEFCSVKYVKGSDYQITEIADGAFAYNTILSRIVISENIKSIGQQAFYNCENLTEINIPEGITEIKYNTFYGCKRLENITLPNSLASIGHGAFDQTAIRNLTIPENVSNLDMIVSENSSLEEIHIKSVNISAEQLTSLASSIPNLKIYIPDDYYNENYELYFNQYIDQIYPENGTYPETPEEPEGKNLSIIFKNGDNIVSNETYTILDDNVYVKVPEDPTQKGKVFYGWELNGEIYDYNQIEYMLINDADKYEDTVTFIALFYDEPKLLEEFDINGQIKEDIESLTIVQKYCQVQKHTNIATYNSKEELLENKSLYVGKKFAYKNEKGSYDYLGVVDDSLLSSYADQCSFPLTCSSIETYMYDLSGYSEEEIYNFKSRNNYSIELSEGEFYIGSESVVFEYKEFKNDLAEKNIKTIIFTEGTIFYDYALIDCSSLEKIILENPTIITVANTDSSQVEESENLQIPEKVKVYVPDNLINAYKPDKTWSKVADQIHPMSELAEG